MPAYGPPSPDDFHTVAVYLQGDRYYDQYVLVRICASQDEKRWAIVDFSDGHLPPAVEQAGQIIAAAMKARLQQDPHGLTWEWVRSDLRDALKRQHFGMAQLSAPFAGFDQHLGRWRNRLVVPVIEVPGITGHTLAG